MRKENGKWVVNAACNKAVYRTINSALAAYKKFAKFLKRWDLATNQHDPCVWNSTTLGEKLTLIFHIGDAMLTHLNPSAVTD